jgi:circadian clock protein KaiC
MDCWISLRDVEASGERNRVLFLLKSRGMNHSKQLREYRLTDKGIDMVDAYLGPEGVLTGSARAAQEAREREQELARRQSIERRRRELARRRAATERQVAELMAALEAEESEVSTLIEQEEARETAFEADRVTMAVRRDIRK